MTSEPYRSLYMLDSTDTIEHILDKSGYGSDEAYLVATNTKKNLWFFKDELMKKHADIVDKFEMVFPGYGNMPIRVQQKLTKIETRNRKLFKKNKQLFHAYWDEVEEDDSDDDLGGGPVYIGPAQPRKTMVIKSEILSQSEDDDRDVKPSCSTAAKMFNRQQLGLRCSGVVGSIELQSAKASISFIGEENQDDKENQDDLPSELQNVDKATSGSLEQKSLKPKMAPKAARCEKLQRKMPAISSQPSAMNLSSTPVIDDTIGKFEILSDGDAFTIKHFVGDDIHIYDLSNMPLELSQAVQKQLILEHQFYVKYAN